MILKFTDYFTLKVTLKTIKNDIKNNLPIILIWAGGLFVRFYRQSYLLGFFFDQGRDAKMAYQIIAGNNFPAIGPTTGIEGLFLGPFWYYLITPGYFLSGGNPAIAACFISFIESLSIPLIFFILRRFNKRSAYLGAFLWAFSYYIVRSSRWFSNPSPLAFFVFAIIFCLQKIFQDKKSSYWPAVTFLLGVSLQLEAASAIFFFPVIISLILLNKSTVKKTKPKIWLKSLIAFLVLLLPQIAFEIKNKFLVSKNFIKFLSGDINSDTGKSWAIPDFYFLKTRFERYYHILFSKLDTNVTQKSTIFLIILTITVIFLIIKHRHHKLIQIVLIWFFFPLFLLLFFTGNYGQLYDYYLTGFFPAFFIIIALSVSIFKSKIFYLGMSLLILVPFALGNFSFLRYYLIAGVDGPQHISLGNQKQAVEIICKDTLDQPYNLSVYVPPVITHTYDYLFDWYTRKDQCNLPVSQAVDLIYSLHEVDIPHPKRLEDWLQSKIPTETIVSETKFGGVVVQQRQRIYEEN